ncbi:hypothetical protein SAMN05443144_12633 [Fodinibius roseus]|uniref:Uncharacterized protein n=1 Tax=Fodinibius roseus TaxID=1194090 RepID=A0A1M5JBB8_9BACT|nr:hypothetical protein [Fodinibius roseus]SHG37579.1 hypothetical protein SAMN05443144_12633 [Fodinibius roseus]
MSILPWFILIAAFMFFMHRGYSSIGDYGGGHVNGSRDRRAPGTGGKLYSKPNLDAMEEVEYEEVESESGPEINPPNNTAKTGTLYSIE